MKNNNVLVDKSFQFAIRTVKLYKYLCEDKKEFILSKQLLRAGTSIGANINESQDAHAGALRLNPAVKRGPSKNDFVSKLSISLKEGRESKYWLELLKETDYLTNKEAESILNDLEEVIKLLVSIIKTTKENIKNESK